MTDRDIMQQALKALETANKSDFWIKQEFIVKALRERLAQPEQEPDIYPDEAYEMGLERIAYYTTPPPQPNHIVDANKMVPLTDEEIRHFWREATMKPKYTSELVEDFARAIEAAHGIKVEA